MSTIVDINIDIQKQIWLWCYTKLPEQPEQSQGQNHTRRSWPGCCICHVLTAPDPNTSWEGTKKKKPVIDQCWIHRVLGSVTIIQRSSRNFMHEFLSCCLARILSAGWTQHCYAKCKKNKMNKMNIMNNNSLCFFMSTFLPSEPSHSASVGTWRAHLVVNFKEGLAWHLQARLRTWNAGDAGSDQAKWLKRTGTYFFLGVLMYKPSKLQLTTSWYVS